MHSSLPAIARRRSSEPGRRLLPHLEVSNGVDSSPVLSTAAALDWEDGSGKERKEAAGRFRRRGSVVEYLVDLAARVPLL